MTNTKMLLLATGLLISTAFVAVALPSASAHSCKAVDPATACGNCNSGTHDHRYNNETNYCSSSGGDPGTGYCRVPGPVIGTPILDHDWVDVGAKTTTRVPPPCTFDDLLSPVLRNVDTPTIVNYRS